MTNISISIHNVAKSYDKTPALKQVSFDVEKSEIFGLIGPDGAGKTTLIRILTTLLIADKGEVFLEGLEAVRDYKEIRKIIGYMPGRFSLYEDLSVEENLNFFATVFGTTIEENYDLIKLIYSQIEPFKTRRAGALSGGMKQKLALSCALIHRPKVLILDEPTTGVDAVSRKEFWEMLFELKKKGITILVSTPYMDEAEMCDRVALMQKGNIMAIDKPINIVRNFQKNIYAIQSDSIYHLIEDLENYPDNDSVHLFGQYLHYTDKNDILDESRLKKFLDKKDHKNIIIKKISPNIEDCFMALLMKQNGNEKNTD